MLVITYNGYRVKELVLFAITQATFLQFWTPDSLRGWGNGTPNGALWTITVFVQFYIVSWLLHKLLKGRKPIIWITSICMAVVVSMVLQMAAEAYMPEVIVKLYDQTVIRYLWMFLLGMFVAEYFETFIGFLMKFWYVFIFISTALGFGGVDLKAGYGVFGSVCLFLGVIGIAYRFPQLNIKKDISYGMYIYHGLVINTMICFGLVGNIGYGIVCFGISVLIGLFSTDVVGRAARKLFARF